jgi:hypothetical protein
VASRKSKGRLEKIFFNILLEFGEQNKAFGERGDPNERESRNMTINLGLPG